MRSADLRSVLRGHGHRSLGLDLEGLVLDCGNRSGKVFLLRRTVSDIDDLIEHFGILFEGHVDDGS